MVLRQEPGEEHPVPVLVGDLGDQGLVAAELALLRPEGPAELAVGLGELVEGLVAIHRKGGQGSTGGGLGRGACLPDGAVEGLAELAREGGHGLDDHRSLVDAPQKLLPEVVDVPLHVVR